MSAADMVIIVISGLFLVGVMVGIAVVYALSARKADREPRRSRSEAASCEYKLPVVGPQGRKGQTSENFPRP
jgi:hypothetical protein